MIDKYKILTVHYFIFHAFIIFKNNALKNTISIALNLLVATFSMSKKKI